MPPAASDAGDGVAGGRTRCTRWDYGESQLVWTCTEAAVEIVYGQRRRCRRALKREARVRARRGRRQIDYGRVAGGVMYSGEEEMWVKPFFWTAG